MMMPLIMCTSVYLCTPTYNEGENHDFVSAKYNPDHQRGGY